MSKLFGEQLAIVNLGLSSFADAARTQGAAVIHPEWQPPAAGDRDTGLALARLFKDPRVEAANRQAYAAYLASQPVWVGMGRAKEVVPGMGAQMILHSGPPIAWDEMCGPVQGAIIGAILFEGWADSPQAARALAASGQVAFEPCQHHHAVGPMGGIISPSMPVFVVRDSEHGHLTFSNMNEGLGKVLRFGAYSDDVLERLAWMRDELAPVLAGAIEALGGVELKPLMAQALHMGDEVHNRNAAATGLLLKKLVPAILRLDIDAGLKARAIEFVSANDHFFLNLSMAACKAMLLAAEGVPGSSMVTGMGRNGVRFGIRLSGTGDTWFTAPAPVVHGLFFSGFGPDDAAPDLGDSVITETAGVGGFAMAASPAIVRFVGGSASDALAHSLAMREITLGQNPAFTLPSLDFASSAAGIDARKVVDTGIMPVINTGIAHKEAGVGQVGAGITHAPAECFHQALRALAQTLAD
ncbi:DUF1116 domain-containing protein [Crenobacter caeni]|uniref:DUF1116 domain-containing protein n=1 Tax=Crenobacter caeni TaxID=2705474 RepID=A0A6B2KU46_9NEIS|nr:DUF1116 domain-containing protein [Crenobacter caeni]NDV13553.1 DUF1116 domain-containing protein [Crenobacter caeni]